MKRAQPVTCRTVRDEIFTLGRGNDVSTDLREHLGQCQSCGALAHEVGLLIDAARDVSRQGLSDEVREATRRTLELDAAALAREAQHTWMARARRSLAAWRYAWLAVGAATATATAVLVAGLPMGPKPRAVIAAVRALGEPPVLAHAAGMREPARVGVALAAGDELILGAESRAMVTLDATRIVALAATRLQVASLRRQRTVVTLDEGEVAVSVDPHGRTKRFLVNTSRAQVEVVGTRFSVTTSARQTAVAVERGQVNVRPHDGAPLVVHTGERIVLSDGAGPVRERLTAGDLNQLVRTLDPTAWETQLRPHELAPTAPKKDEPAPIPRGGKVAPASRAKPAPREDPLIAVTRAAGEKNCARAETLARAAGLGAETQAEALGLAADCHYAAGDDKRALGIYAEVARRFARTPAGANAAYEVGKIEQRRGRRDAALRAFASYLRMYPSGVLAEDALYNTCSLRTDAGAVAQSLECVERYRRRYPQGKRATDIYLIEATLLRLHRQDCRGAIAAYERYLGQGGKYAEEARTWIAWCRAKLEERP